MKNVSRYLLFAVLLFIFVLDFAINARDRFDSEDGWEIHFGDITTESSAVELSSGFIINPSGHVLANSHATEHTEQIMILTNNDINYGLAVVDCDPACEMELLRIKTPNGQLFCALPIIIPDITEAGNMDYSGPSRWAKELLDDIHASEGDIEEP